MPQSGPGRIVLFDDFTGPEIPITLAVAAKGAAGYAFGPFAAVGDLVETDTGFAVVSKSNGFIRVSGNNEDGKGAAIGTAVCWSPALNGTLVLETRLERAAVTAGVVFAGFGALFADDIAEPCTSTGTTITPVDTVYAGFLLDSQFTASAQWHMPYYGGATTGVTTGATVACGSGVVAVAAECDVLRIEIDNNGTARWYINGVLEQTKAGAVSTTTLLSGYVGCWGTTITAATVDVDYLLVEANRDWTR